ncbi:nucleoid-associated protein [Olivibacter sp. SDN3]|uniref:nucleoid-associated protein n=1 Tax=Olivibacter sp. SDN3 TaxID=2764720 RepID=UPI00165158D8|nr:nucleoid-associated protein [Olivibacter sp. SDN3]QNL49004.1 nucleoid-associated protein [Olivibacter sp. SDN3]
MLSHFEASLAQLSIHRIGNKLMDDHYILSESPLNLTDELLPKLLMQYFLSPFEKVQEVFRLTHHSGNLALNELFHFSSSYFDGTTDFHEVSQYIAKHLYNVSNHPKIKAGEVYVVSFENVQLEGESYNALGIFKSETKETYLKVFPEHGAFKVGYEEEGINIQKLDKGCLIVNAEKEHGFKVLAVDQTNRQNEAIYWKDDFLQLKIRNDNFNQTGNLLQVCKKFVSEKLDEAFEMERTDKIDLLNRSMTYFKEKDKFEVDEFTEEVLGNPEAVSMFKDYKSNFEREYDMEIADSFEISNSAVKKQSKIFKSILKLDKNFHVYIHGKRERIEKGFDDEKGMAFYKLYFETES